MVRARLHLICGNCGCNDEWEWKHYPEEVIGGEMMRSETVAISCKNCSTIHYLNDNAKQEEQHNER